MGAYALSKKQEITIREYVEKIEVGTLSAHESLQG